MQFENANEILLEVINYDENKKFLLELELTTANPQNPNL